MFAVNIFANGSLSTKFTKIFSHENFPLYGLCSHNLVTAHSHACMAYSNTLKYSTQCITQLCDANIVRACYGKVSDQQTHTYMIYFHRCGHCIALQCTCIIKHYLHIITCYLCILMIVITTSIWSACAFCCTVQAHGQERHMHTLCIDMTCTVYTYVRTYVCILVLITTNTYNYHLHSHSIYVRTYSRRKPPQPQGS